MIKDSKTVFILIIVRLFLGKKHAFFNRLAKKAFKNR